ncbi:MAG: GT4 family glycosyltransferase PelF [Selenomonas sp.]|uniref:GT4 family glycosyltransferase PelF n=1 Tax=Selenomonas sp. TaxID=2053611 RepID=UPI0025CF40B3|nr:GT4 family glycosyltransferase PelF [Selenomonas sp.]MCR5756947.1 GT4 family glycosyltransferase PelF [Selenomonas sp.]
MRICLLTEGSYPYVVGGVSSWCQMLIQGLPQHEFFIYSIGAEARDRGAFKYKFPPNLKGVQEEFLDEILEQRSQGMLENILTAEEQEAIYDLVLGGNPLDIHKLASIFRKRHRFTGALDIFMSSDFFDIIQRVYMEKYSYLPFTDFFWTIRSMLLPLLYLLQQDLPKADVYHSVATGYCGVIGAMAAEIYHKPFIITEHGIYSREREVEIIKSDWAKGDFKSVWIQYFYNLAKLSYKTADRVYTLFEHNAEIEQDLGCAAHKIGIVPNGVHMERFARIGELQQHDGPLVLGAIVRVVPIKDIVTLLRAFFLFKEEFPDARLVIMGGYDEDPDYFALCQQTVSMLGITDVEFAGSVNVVEYLPQMDFLLLSSISEGQPLAVLEGFAAHRPFVTTDVGCCRELIYGDSSDSLGVAGAVVAPMDFEAMAREMIRLGRDFALRQQMGNIGYQRVRRSYTYEHFIARYREIYQMYVQEA